MPEEEPKPDEIVSSPPSRTCPPSPHPSSPTAMAFTSRRNPLSQHHQVHVLHLLVRVVTGTWKLMANGTRRDGAKGKLLVLEG